MAEFADDLPQSGADPIEEFQRWHLLAQASEDLDGTACCLATASADGRPSARMVLYRGLHHGRFSFYSNFESRKAAELRDNPQAALLFHWQTVGKQLRIEGEVERLPPEVSDRYFATRPRGSQLGAWASTQSHRLESRDELMHRLKRLETRFEGAEIPRPAFWGGYGLLPLAVEFWQQGEHRLHQRRRFTRSESGWESELLAP